MAQATAPRKRRLAERGGVQKLPASGGDYVLTRAEIDQLIALAQSLPERFPAIVDVTGATAPADIEFGFLDGRLQLFQIRPFLESRRARGNSYLNALDANLQDLNLVSVNLNETPQ